MLRKLPVLALVSAALVAVALVACNREQPSATTPAPAVTPPNATQPQDTVKPIAPATGLAHFDGYGDMRFGMTADEAKQAWAGQLNGKPGPGEICYYFNPVSNPAPAYFAFMIESDKFVRYDVGNDKEVAPGGGKRGMSADQIRTLYAGHIKQSPHKYVQGGQYLRIKADDGSDGVLLFETDAAGKVTAWRVGQAPQVDYIEGCS